MMFYLFRSSFTKPRNVIWRNKYWLLVTFVYLYKEKIGYSEAIIKLFSLFEKIYMILIRCVKCSEFHEFKSRIFFWWWIRLMFGYKYWVLKVDYNAIISSFPKKIFSSSKSYKVTIYVSTLSDRKYSRLCILSCKTINFIRLSYWFISRIKYLSTQKDIFYYQHLQTKSRIQCSITSTS